MHKKSGRKISTTEITKLSIKTLLYFYQSECSCIISYTASALFFTFNFSNIDCICFFTVLVLTKIILPIYLFVYPLHTYCITSFSLSVNCLFIKLPSFSTIFGSFLVKVISVFALFFSLFVNCFYNFSYRHTASLKKRLLKIHSVISCFSKL